MSYFETFVCSVSGFRVPGNDVMSAIMSLYLEVFAYGTFILWSILYTLDCIVEHFQADGLDTKHYFGVKAIHGYNFPKYFHQREESLADICFSAFPTTVVVLLLVPTLGFLYSMEHTLFDMDTYMSIDIIGHQWYWSYEYCFGAEDNDSISDSILDIDAIVNANLEVDPRMVVPTEVNICPTFTSTDVIHSRAVPQLGIKVDAVPGRIATTILSTFADGIYYGQCSELCGVLHGSMPICVQSVPMASFLGWAMILCEADKFIYTN